VTTSPHGGPYQGRWVTTLTTPFVPTYGSTIVVYAPTFDLVPNNNYLGCDASLDLQSGAQL
jgi:hypothetical protein